MSSKSASSTSSLSLDLSRRRLAAISFLSNISTDAEGVTEIRLDCLQVRVNFDYALNSM